MAEPIGLGNATTTSRSFNFLLSSAASEPDVGSALWTLNLYEAARAAHLSPSNAFQADSVSQVVLHSTRHVSEEDDIQSVRFMF